MIERAKMEHLAATLIALVGMYDRAYSQTAVVSPAAKQRATPDRAKRDFLLTYATDVRGLQKHASARLWLPIPCSNEDQNVQIVSEQLPGRGTFAKEPKYGNEVLFVDAQADGSGELHATLTFQIKRFATRVDSESRDGIEDEARLFLKPDAKVPSTGKPLQLLNGHDLPAAPAPLSRLLYDIVYEHMTYSKHGTGWGQGDSNWACESGYGNCSDFHSLFISLARSQNIPAKFEIGFSLPDERGHGNIMGYHCWAKFLNGRKHWVPVDISEAKMHPEFREFYFGNLNENRVMMTVGRDLVLVPKQNGPPLNFFIFPYIEVQDQPYPSDKIMTTVTYSDMESDDVKPSR